MDEETIVAISGALTAQKYILENIYALILAQNPDPAAAARATAAEMLRQFEDLPSNTLPGAPVVEGSLEHEITQHAVHHLERFWLGVESRLHSQRD